MTSLVGPDQYRDTLRTLLAAPDIVYVGLGFPRQERLITQLAPSLPCAWFVACGAAIGKQETLNADERRWK